MLLLDTCTLLWLATGSKKLSDRARDAIAAHAGRLHVSGITGLEIALKHARGALTLPLAPDEWVGRALRRHGLAEVPVTLAIAARSGMLPPLHRDPFDRILVATAQLRALTLLTPDPAIAAYPDLRICW
ncbi:MAG: type II toxin-antitoxin system VapC family toxin [Deltaproteobacteria bacterium]|nr:type II toxin-antitoxin system VapC family toxin [Deltaproteobacteria bacterium]